MNTLVIGARGSVGQLVLDGLIARGVPVRASARRPEPGQFRVDLTEPATLIPAFDGVEQVFLYANRESVPGVLEAARETGVRRIVLLSSGSVLHPTSAGNPITEEHRAIEDAFAAAPDLTVIPIRPLVLATNALPWTRPGPVALYRPEARTAPIHERDIAAVAVAALTGDDDTTGILTGPVRLSQRDQVAAIRPDATVNALTRTEGLAHFSRFMPAPEAEAVLRFLDDAAAGNSLATDTVERILGRPALSFDTWVADHTAG